MDNWYEAHDHANCIYSYKIPDGDWSPCPRCGLRPMTWTFDNGRSTACGCWTSMYDHFSIHAESIASVVQRSGGSSEYDPDELRTNWNHWCQTGEVLFEHASKRSDGRW
jgi:hypothetical protein